MVIFDFSGIAEAINDMFSAMFNAVGEISHYFCSKPLYFVPAVIVLVLAIVALIAVVFKKTFKSKKNRRF